MRALIACFLALTVACAPAKTAEKIAEEMSDSEATSRCFGDLNQLVANGQSEFFTPKQQAITETRMGVGPDWLGEPTARRWKPDVEMLWLAGDVDNQWWDCHIDTKTGRAWFEWR